MKRAMIVGLMNDDMNAAALEYFRWTIRSAQRTMRPPINANTPFANVTLIEESAQPQRATALSAPRDSWSDTDVFEVESIIGRRFAASTVTSGSCSRRATREEADDMAMRRTLRRQEARRTYCVLDHADSVSAAAVEAFASGLDDAERALVRDEFVVKSDVELGHSGWQYRIRWKGYTGADSESWEPTEHVTADDAITDFYRRALQSTALVAVSDERFVSSLDPIAARVHEFGVVHIHDTLPAETVKLLRSELMARYDAVRRHLRSHPRAHDEFVANGGFVDFKPRDNGRVDMQIDIRQFRQLTDASVPWLSTIRAVLGADAKMIHAGVIISEVGSDAQEYHQDGPHHAHTQQEMTHNAVHALNVFIPLVDLTAAVGATEFVPSSHVNGAFHLPFAPVSILAGAGQSIIFDYRLRHRGLAKPFRRYAPRRLLDLREAVVH